MTLRRLSPGETLTGVPAATWNAFCDAAARVPSLPGGDAATPAAPRGRVIVALTAAHRTGEAVGLGAAAFLPARGTGSDAARAAARVVEVARGTPVFAEATLEDDAPAFAVLQNGGRAGDQVPAVVAGVALAAVDVRDPAHLAVAPRDGALVSVASGPCRLLQAPAETGEGLALVLLAPGHERAVGGDDCYEIDRTDPDDDALSWDPANDEPSDWQDYARVKLTTQTPRLTAGGGIEFVTVEQTWAAAWAPTIAAATTAAAGTTCEE